MLSATRKGGGSWNSRGSHRCLWCTFISFEIQMMILMLPSQFRSDGDDGVWRVMEFVAVTSPI